MYLEADVLYSYLKPEDWLKSDAERILSKEEKFITSISTIVEIEIISLRDYDSKFSLSVFSWLKNLKNLQIIPLTLEIEEKAVDIRKKHELSIFDSVHAATCLIKKEKIVSTDPVFDKIDNLERIDPRNLFV